MSSLLVLVSLLSVCSALSHRGLSQIGSPIVPGFVPVGGSLSTGAFVARDLSNGFGGFGKRDVFRRACGSSNLGTCSNDPTVCCEIGGKCCGNGRCCPTGNVCQTNVQGDLICCPTGGNCSNFIPDNPCMDKTAFPCANFAFCCPNNNSCSIVNGQNICTPIGVSAPPVVSSSTKVSISSVSPTTIKSITSSTKLVTSSTTVSSPVIKSQTSSSIVSSPPVVSSSSPTVQTHPTIVTTTLPPVVVTTTPPATTLTTAPTTPSPQPVTSTPPPQPTTVIISGTTETTRLLETSISIAQPSTVIEYSTIISSIEISSGVFSATDVVLSSTRIFTPSPDNPTGTPGVSSSSTKSSTIAIIAGASIGGTLLLVAIGFIIFFCARRGRTPPQPEPIPPPMREPTVPVLPPDVPDRYRAVSMSTTVSELTPAASPAPRYSTMYAPPENIAEMQAPGYVPQEMEGGKYGYSTTSHELPSQGPYVDPRTQGYGQQYGGRGY